MKNPSSGYEYQYAISDHQGNTRVVFTSADPIAQNVTATFEAANQAIESTQFSNYPTGAHIKTAAAKAHRGTNSLWLNGGYAGQVGLANGYKVFPGDKLSIQAYAKDSVSSGTGNLNGFAQALLTAFNLATPAPGELGTPSSAINTFGGLEAGGWGDGTTDNSDPKVFVNIVIFDRNYKFLDVAYAQLTTSGALMSANYTVKEAGYAYLYVSNENPTLIDVYFDDVTMSYTPSNIVQSNEYYAHGLPTNNSWTRDNAVANNFLANGATELNSTTSLYDLDFRNFDPVLGRLNQVDPMADKYSSSSTYHFSFNNPVSSIDPSGADPNGNPFIHPPDEPYDWFGFNSNMGRDQAYAHGGQIRSDGAGGYFRDEDGNGVQNGGEVGAGISDIRAEYGWSSAYVTSDRAKMAAILSPYLSYRSPSDFVQRVIRPAGMLIAQMLYGGDGKNRDLNSTYGPDSPVPLSEMWASLDGPGPGKPVVPWVLAGVSLPGLTDPNKTPFGLGLKNWDKDVEIVRWLESNPNSPWNSSDYPIYKSVGWGMLEGLMYATDRILFVVDPYHNVPVRPWGFYQDYMRATDEQKLKIYYYKPNY